MTEVTLKPCPFCGGEAEIREYDPRHPYEFYGLIVAHSGDCFLNLPQDEEALYSAWNLRARPEPASADVVEALGEALHTLSDRLRKVGALDLGNVHAAYESVVKRFAALTAAPDASEAQSGEAGADVVEARGRVWTRWDGGFNAPSDWNGGRVLLASGEIVHPYQSDDDFDWQHYVSETECIEPGCIVGYVSNASNLAPSTQPSGAQQPEPKQPSDGLEEHFSSGLRSTLHHIAGTGEIIESPIKCECHCGASFCGTDEQEVRQLWAEHVSLALRNQPKPDEAVRLLKEARVKLADVQGTTASKHYACNLISRIDAYLGEQS